MGAVLEGQCCLDLGSVPRADYACGMVSLVLSRWWEVCPAALMEGRWDVILYFEGPRLRPVLAQE